MTSDVSNPMNNPVHGTQEQVHQTQCIQVTNRPSKLVLTHKSVSLIRIRVNRIL